MALIKCPECNKEVSDSAAMCPHCGFRLKIPQGTALFKCADNGGWNTAWIKRTVELIDAKTNFTLRTFQMGGSVSISIKQPMSIKIHVHGYMSQPIVNLQPGRNVYVNIMLKAGGALGGGFCSAQVVNMGGGDYFAETDRVEEKKIEEPEFVFVKPDESNPIAEGSIVKVVQSVYASSVGQRITNADICTVESIDGDRLTVYVDKTSAKFRYFLERNNVVVKIKNPKYVAPTIKEDSPADKNDNLDKFEEIKKYKELLDMGIITQEEFDEKKKELLR